MKKVLSLILAVAMLLSLTVVASATKFADVDSNYSWAESAIEALSEDGIITGYEDGTFKPGKSITRQEAITLFSKALGASAESNEFIVNFAYGLYEAELLDCIDSYAVKQGAYLAYRKVITIDEVLDYLSSENRNLELKRYEAAALIAKALGADSWLKNNPDVDTTLTYKDANSVPAKFVDYVFYTTTLGIMGDMGDNKFGPDEKVTRAQIAVMIKRIADMMEFDFESGVIATVDTLNNNLSVRVADGDTLKIVVNNSNVIYIDATKSTLNDLKTGMEIALIFSKGELYEIDAVSYTEDETVSGAYKGQLTDNSGTTIKIADVTMENQPVSSYKMASNAIIVCDGKTSDISAIKSGDYVIAQLSGGLVVNLISEAKEKTIDNLKVTEINTASENGIEITVLDKEDMVYKYILADDAVITKNLNTAQLTDLVVGDTVRITLEYGVIKNIRATGVSKTLEGTIEEITISNATSYITIAKDGSKSKYVMSRNCSVELMGEAATIYDLRLGSYVKLETSSETVVNIKAEAVSSALQVTGTIKTINPSYGLLIIEMESPSGAVVEKQLFVKDSTKILDSTTNKMLTIKGLKVGNIITAAGVEKLGVYEVNSIMVLQ